MIEEIGRRIEKNIREDLEEMERSESPRQKKAHDLLKSAVDKMTVVVWLHQVPGFEDAVQVVATALDAAFQEGVEWERGNGE